MNWYVKKQRQEKIRDGRAPAAFRVPASHDGTRNRDVSAVACRVPDSHRLPDLVTRGPYTKFWSKFVSESCQTRIHLRSV